MGLFVPPKRVPPKQRIRTPVPIYFTLVPKLQLGYAVREAQLRRCGRPSRICIREAELPECAFPSWSLGTSLCVAFY